MEVCRGLVISALLAEENCVCVIGSPWSSSVTAPIRPVVVAGRIDVVAVDLGSPSRSGGLTNLILMRTGP